MPYSNVFKPNGGIPTEISKATASKRTRPVPAARTASSGGNASTDLALGDFYAIDGNGNAYRAGPNDTIRGLVIGFEFQANPTVMNGNGPLSLDYITGTGNKSGSQAIASIIGIEDNQCIIEMQADQVPAGVLPYGTYNLVDQAPDSLFRISNQYVSLKVAGTQLKFIGVKQSPWDNSPTQYTTIGGLQTAPSAITLNPRVLVQMTTALPG